MSANDEFVEELAAVSRKWRTLVDARVKDRGMTLARARALIQLSEASPLSQRELAETLDVETPTLVRLLDGLAEQGFVERHPVEGDRRTNHVVLTEAARPLAAELRAIVRGARDEFLADVDPEDLAAALRVLRSIGRRIEETGR